MLLRSGLQLEVKMEMIQQQQDELTRDELRAALALYEETKR